MFIAPGRGQNGSRPADLIGILMFESKNLRGAPARSHAHARFAELVADYPNLSPHQLTEVTELFPQLSALEMALMMSDDRLAGKLDRFRVEQRRRIRTPFSQYAVLVAIALGGLAMLAFGLVFSPG